MGIADRWITLFNKPIPNVILRLVVLFGGFLSMAMSIALMRTTGLGNSPISCIPATLSYLVPLSLGTITFIMNTCFLIVQAILLRRDFNPVQLLQIPFTFVFALMIDQLLPFCETLPMQYYPEQLGWNILGCFLLAMGVFLQVKASFITLPGEGIVLAIAKAAKKPFPKCKIAFDSSMVVVSVVISFMGLGYLQGVREGTIITALAAGTIVALIGKLLPHFDRFCPVEGHISFIINVPMSNDEQPNAPENEGQPPLVIAIERQYGSGGREIGTLVGKELGIPSFDHTLIDLTAQESGFPPAYVKQHEQEVRRGLLYNLYMQNYRSVGAEPEQMDDMWLAQARAITKLADEGCLRYRRALRRRHPEGPEECAHRLRPRTARRSHQPRNGPRWPQLEGSRRANQSHRPRACRAQSPFCEHRMECRRDASPDSGFFNSESERYRQAHCGPCEESVP